MHAFLLYVLDVNLCCLCTVLFERFSTSMVTPYTVLLRL